MSIKPAGLALLVLTASAAFVTAGADPHSHHSQDAGAPKSESTAAFEAVNEKMHKEMAVAYSGDADVDFVKGMIPHHEGAVEMAKVQLKYGKDPELRKLAEDIIKAQDTEIAFMKGWLSKR